MKRYRIAALWWGGEVQHFTMLVKNVATLSELRKLFQEHGGIIIEPGPHCAPPVEVPTFIPYHAILRITDVTAQKE